LLRKTRVNGNLGRTDLFDSAQIEEKRNIHIAGRPHRDTRQDVLETIAYITKQSPRMKIQSPDPAKATPAKRAPSASSVLDAISDAVLCTDVPGLVTYLNPAAEYLTGWTNREAIGYPLAQVFHIVDGAMRELAVDTADKAVREDKTFGLVPDCILVRRDGVEHYIEDSVAPIHDRQGRVTGAVIVFRDVSAIRDEAVRVIHQARHDPLTNLPNRLLFSDRIARAIALADRHGRQGAVLFLDLDHFKQINDSFGHAMGDRLLQSVAQRIVGSVRESDTVSRRGGDEFVVLLPEIAHAKEAVLGAQRILHALSAAHRIVGREVRTTASIGISLYPDRGWDSETLIAHADVAMYQAKLKGRNRYEVFGEYMHVRATQRNISAGEPETN
jgi:diguanylate cyclase (GGDEF)-like protein/PAS domain S-box-containing protein